MNKRNAWGGYGGLGPDIDRDTVKLKSAIRAKVSDFSNQLREINRVRLAGNSENLETQSVTIRETCARARGLEFAKSVPRPKRVLSSAPVFAISARQESLNYMQSLMDRYDEMELEVRRIKFRNNLSS